MHNIKLPQSTSTSTPLSHINFHTLALTHTKTTRTSRHRSQQQQFINQYSYLNSKIKSVNSVQQFYNNLRKGQGLSCLLPAINTNINTNININSSQCKNNKKEHTDQNIIDNGNSDGLDNKIERINRLILNKLQQTQTNRNRNRNIYRSSQHIHLSNNNYKNTNTNNPYNNNNILPIQYPQTIPIKYYYHHNHNNQQQLQVQKLQVQKLQVQKLQVQQQRQPNSLKTNQKIYRKSKLQLKSIENLEKQMENTLNIYINNKNKNKNQVDYQNRNIDKNKKKLKQRFKIIGIVVYFCIFFPKYSRRFTLNRRKYIKQIQLPKWQSLKTNIFNKLYKQIDYQQLYCNSLQQQQHNLLIDWQDLTNTALTPSNSKNIPKQSLDIIKIQQIINFTQQFLYQIQQIITQNIQYFDQLIKFMMIGVSNCSFMRENIYYQEQTNIINVDIKKKYIRIDGKLESVLVMIRVFIGIIVKELLMGHNKGQKVKSKQSNTRTNEKQQFYIRTKQINKLRENSAKLLSSICHQIWQKHSKKSKQSSSTRIQRLCYLPKFRQNYMQKQDTYKVFQQNIDKINIKQCESLQPIKQQILRICQIFMQQTKQQKYKHYEEIRDITLMQKYNSKDEQIVQQIDNQDYQQLPSYQKQIQKCKAQRKRQAVNDKIVHKLNKKSIKQIPVQQKQKQNQRPQLILNHESKPEQNLKPFHLDVLNLKSNERRADQIRQKFRNIFNKK